MIAYCKFYSEYQSVQLSLSNGLSELGSGYQWGSSKIKYPISLQQNIPSFKKFNAGHKVHYEPQRARRIIAGVVILVAPFVIVPDKYRGCIYKARTYRSGRIGISAPLIACCISRLASRLKRCPFPFSIPAMSTCHSTVTRNLFSKPRGTLLNERHDQAHRIPPYDKKDHYCFHQKIEPEENRTIHLP